MLFSGDGVSEYNKAKRADDERDYECWETVFGFVDVVVAFAEVGGEFVG